MYHIDLQYKGVSEAPTLGLCKAPRDHLDCKSFFCIVLSGDAAKQKHFMIFTFCSCSIITDSAGEAIDPCLRTGLEKEITHSCALLFCWIIPAHAYITAFECV